MIPYGKQDISEDDIDSVLKVLKSDFLTQGEKVIMFEQALSNYCQVDYGIALNSATSALHVACLALDLNQGDIVWTSPNSFVASANCALFCGAYVDFVDIDPKTYNLSVDLLEEKLIEANQKNKLPKIIIPVHFAGQSCDMERIHELSKRYGFKILEDASHAVGGKYKSLPVGNCHYSDITVFSFHPVKIITTAEGGMAVTKPKKLINKMRLIRSHGVTRDEKLIRKKKYLPYYYEQVELGFNYRMTELQAALGLSQLNRLDDFVSRRHQIKKRYDLTLQNEYLTKPFQNINCYSSMHLYPIKINSAECSKSRDEVFLKLRQEGVGVNVHYIPIHTQPFYKSLGFKEGDFPNSEDYFKNALSIPIFSSMNFNEQDKVIESLINILKT